jgi:hypothetical protein
LGSLTGFLQERFAASCPTGWSCTHEVDILDANWQRVLGYSARADVLLTRNDGQKRLWIEFEVSRADPVANHAKFATSHLFVPQAPTDTFIAMVSSHVTRGRRNLAANTILLMRRVGMRAFQTVLLPTIAPDEIRRLNHLPISELSTQLIDAETEISRAMLVSDAISSSKDYELHYAGDLFEVFSNVQRWNDEVTTDQGSKLWGKRTVKYFVYDSATNQFAPSKFCAYINAIPQEHSSFTADHQLMSMPLYTSLDESEPKFDGNLAQTHLQRNLNMLVTTRAESPHITHAFAAWQATHNDHISTHPSGPVFLMAPRWFI